MRLPRLLAAALLAAACASPPAAPASAAADPALFTKLQPLQVTNLAMPAPHLLTAGQPTETQFEQLAKNGVSRIVCLRAPNEPGTGWEEAKAKALGVQFVRLPIAGGDGVTVENAQKLGQALAAGGDATTLVCCHTSNRVGAMLAMKAFFVDGVPADAALAFGRSAGLKGLESNVAGKLKK